MKKLKAGLPDTILILAAGKADWWKGDIPKQLVDVGGVPLIARTVEQAERIYGLKPLIVSWDTEINKHGKYVFPEYDNWIVETLYSTFPYWEGRVLVLLGDVYFSDNIMANLWTDDRPVVFFGRLLEIYALAFNDHQAIYSSLKNVIDQVRNYPHGENPGKLWHLWYYLNDYPIGHHTYPAKNNKFFRQINPDDPTMDIDYVDDYLELLTKID